MSITTDNDRCCILTVTCLNDYIFGSCETHFNENLTYLLHPIGQELQSSVNKDATKLRLDQVCSQKQGSSEHKLCFFSKETKRRLVPKSVTKAVDLDTYYICAYTGGLSHELGVSAGVLIQ